MLRYIATRIAHERNPYPVGSREWQSYNRGFVKTALPALPSKWELLMAAIYVAPALMIIAAIIALPR